MEKNHFKCIVWKTLWGLGAFSFLVGLTFGASGDSWFWSALVFGVLAVPIKMDCQSCKVCGIE